jgi:methylmalonyl-CoA/ethylmalonyl-CoA epimerase
MDVTSRPARLGLGPIDQVSFAVADLEAVLPLYTELFGPFTTRRVVFDPERVSYRGRPAQASLLLAFGRSGDIEIELVQVEDGDAPAAEHVRRHGDGLHHVRVPVSELTTTLGLLEAEGFTTVLDGTSPRGSRFAYLESPEQLGTTMLELLQESNEQER